MKVNGVKKALAGAWVATIFTLFAATPAAVPFHAAYACTTCGCIASHHRGEPCNTQQVVREEHKETKAHITEEFTDWEKFLRDIMWQQYMLPAMMLMTEQITAVAMQQMMILGAFIDADHQTKAQGLFSELTAKAHEDYHPDTGMCVFGTNVRSLANADRNAEFTSYVLAQRSMDRQMGNMLSPAARGNYDDAAARTRLFRTRYCTPTDNNGLFDDICQGSTPELSNKDVDFGRTVGSAATLGIDFSDLQAPVDGQTDDEKDVFALANNLYSHELMFRLPETVLRSRNAQDELLDMRSVVAKRSVAENSFNTIVGMKTMGSAVSGQETGQYMGAVFKQLGVEDDAEIKKFLGERPSYYAQMDVLTKKLYEQPDFFVDLYETSANTDRKKVAMQAIGLMQDFDTWQSYLRTEAMLSVILELELIKFQTDLQNRINGLRVGGKRG